MQLIPPCKAIINRRRKEQHDIIRHQEEQQRMIEENSIKEYLNSLAYVEQGDYAALKMLSQLEQQYSIYQNNNVYHQGRKQRVQVKQVIDQVLKYSQQKYAEIQQKPKKDWRL
ncbi:Hypothetical_protein [Hexamita inflata]|uniref:Hypothetical_protein n=1 Tax=Hexamita inflata TaxID=28002 RepID=A0AA86RK02_9EUKA|nr:Hypothetical protein HINF_LOCUS63581 [Hexamita inflata]